MYVDRPLDQDQPDLGHGLVRAFRRQRWTGGLLAADVITSWAAAPGPHVAQAAHNATLPIACLIILDLGWSAAQHVRWSLANTDVIVIKLPTRRRR
ncbi:hypothetical protein KHQ06_25445 [Nocardia tengchongensis]|uniref:Uncharacterized protein n=1 Tax=Nocardia tengchongensis TaxID=2055889 RepID=A0ABX8CLC2_9NOCA|nr:hypothetical protein [Nocardia tengchongensis]QVI19688.1 hypothetical protein KHQ06_25445 [Nocardia tengchongensis]